MLAVNLKCYRKEFLIVCLHCNESFVLIRHRSEYSEERQMWDINDQSIWPTRYCPFCGEMMADHIGVIARSNP